MPLQRHDDLRNRFFHVIAKDQSPVWGKGVGGKQLRVYTVKDTHGGGAEEGADTPPAHVGAHGG